MRVTFDSNVWIAVARPKDDHSQEIRAIRKAMNEHKIVPCLSETMFTLEAIKRNDRKDFLSNYNPKINISIYEQNSGELKISLLSKPDKNYHPGSYSILSSLLKDALAIGFKLMKCPRINGFKNPDIKDSYFLEDELNTLEQRQLVFSSVATEIEEKNVGRAQIINLGKKYNSFWFDGIRYAPEEEKKNIAKAVAEWADGDSLAAHIAYKNTYFCTKDNAKSAGPVSVLSPENRRWLKEKYNVQFVTPEELGKKLSDLSTR
jgi:hypothetical protein